MATREHGVESFVAFPHRKAGPRLRTPEFQSPQPGHFAPIQRLIRHHPPPRGAAGQPAADDARAALGPGRRFLALRLPILSECRPRRKRDEFLPAGHAAARRFPAPSHLRAPSRGGHDGRPGRPPASRHGARNRRLGAGARTLVVPAPMEMPIALELGAGRGLAKILFDPAPGRPAVPLHVIGGNRIRDALIAQRLGEPIE